MSQTDLRQPTNPRTKTLVFCAVMLVSAITSGWMLTSRPLEGHECFVTVTAREMTESGDWIVPSYNGQVRLQKTPLNYWLVAITGKITGAIDELSGRLGSVFLAMLSTGAILYFVSQWVGFRAGVLSALVWSTSLGFIRYGRSARPEMSLTCFVTIAMLSLYTAIISTDRKKQIMWALVFWVSFGLAMLAKGPAPLPLVGTPLLVYFVVFRKWKAIPKLLPIVGVIVFLAIVLPWPMLVMDRLADAAGESNTLEFWKAEYAGRFTGTSGIGSKPFYYYMPYLFTFMAPWVAFVVMALAAPFFKVWGQKREAMGYLWLWLVGGVAIMSLSGGKRMHYILPTMPALAILIGIIVEDIVFERVAYTGKFARNVLAIHAGVIVAGAIGGTVYVASKRPELLTGVAVVSLLGLAAVGVTVWLFVKRKNAWATGAIFAGFCVVLMVAMPVMSADASFNRNAEVFAKSVSGTVPAGGRLTAYRDVSSRFVHHYGGVVPVVKDMDSLFETYEQGDWVVATGRLMEEVIADGRFALVKRWEEAEREGDEVVDGAVFGKVEAVENE